MERCRREIPLQGPGGVEVGEIGSDETWKKAPFLPWVGVGSWENLLWKARPELSCEALESYVEEEGGYPVGSR